MQLSKSHLRAAALIACGATAGALGTAGTLGPVGASAPAPSATIAVAPVVGGAALTTAALPPDETPVGARTTAVRRESATLGGAVPSIDPRYLSAPLSERFTQSSPGASNPGQRGAPHRDPLSNMIAAIFPADETTRTIVLSPRVNPPPDDETGGNEEPCEGDCDTPVDPPGGGGDGETPSGVPEIDADLLGAGLLLLIGGALVLASRRPI